MGTIWPKHRAKQVLRRLEILRIPELANRKKRESWGERKQMGWLIKSTRLEWERLANDRLNALHQRYSQSHSAVLALDPRTNMSHVYFETEKAELSHEINLNVSWLFSASFPRTGPLCRSDKVQTPFKYTFSLMINFRLLVNK